MAVVWEYTYIKAGGFDIEKITEALNELGAEGWELVALAPREGVDKSFSAVLKRPRRVLEQRDAGTQEARRSDSSGRRPDRWWDSQ